MFTFFRKIRKITEQILSSDSPVQMRQGDVRLIPVNEIPSTAEKINSKIVARGEISGHAHIVNGADIYMDKDIMYIMPNKTDASIRHLMESTGVWTKEHHGLSLNENTIYRVDIEKEFDPYAKKMREAKD